jgi:hypothetical protein
MAGQDVPGDGVDVKTAADGEPARDMGCNGTTANAD